MVREFKIRRYLILSTKEKEELTKLSLKLAGKKCEFESEIDLSIEPEDIEQIDRSELVEYLFFKIGYGVADGCLNQYYSSIPVSNPATGDLVFAEREGRIGHVGIIIRQSNEWFVVEANEEKCRVVKTKLNAFLKRKESGAVKNNMRRFSRRQVRILNYRILIFYDKLDSIERKMEWILTRLEEVRKLLKEENERNY